MSTAGLMALPATPNPAAGPGIESPAAGEDLLILVMSCRRNAARRRAIRATWGRRLARHGIRHLFVLGEERQPTRLEGDVLIVDSKDNYEYLVLKVLRAMEVVHRQLADRFRYLFKVDDDCFVNPERLLRLPFRDSPYSGRVLRVHEAEPDAAWHVGKCEDKRYEAPYTRPFRCNMATGIGYFLATRHLAPLVAEIPKVADELARGLYDFEDKRVAETLWSAGVPATPLVGYSAVFLDKERRFTEPWRVDPDDEHRFAELDVVTECTSDDLQWVDEVVSATQDQASASAVSAPSTPWRTR